MTMYLFFDTETTGLPKDWKAPISNTSNWPRLVQVAWIFSDGNGKILEEIEYIIYPSDFTIPTAVSDLNGITTELAKNKGEELVKVLKELNEYINEADYLVAHNLNFDEKVIGAEFFRKGIKNNILEKKRICTMERSTKFCALPGYYGYKWPTLSELYFKLFNETFEDAHNALMDVRATQKCFWELVDIGAISIKTVVTQQSIISTSNPILPKSASKTIDSHNSDFPHENEEYIELWDNLSKEWKEQIKSKMPQRKNPDFYFPFDNEYLPGISLKGTINNDEASNLKTFLLNTSIFETGSEVSDLIPLLNFKNLKHLIIGRRYDNSGNFGNKKITTLEQLQYLRNLKSVDCQNCPITSLFPLTNLCELERLDISYTLIQSIEPLSDLRNLKFLKFTCAPVRDISALSMLINIESLNFGCTTSSITDISSLINMTKLKELSLIHNPISDLSPLQNLFNIEALYLSRTNIFDLEPITNLTKIKYLWINGTNVHSLKPLSNMKDLVRIDFDKTPVTDISPILNLPNLKIINCVDNKLSHQQKDKLRINFPNARIYY